VTGLKFLRLDYSDKIKGYNIFENDMIVFDPNIRPEGKITYGSVLPELREAAPLIKQYLDQEKILLCFMPEDERAGEYVNTIFNEIKLTFEFNYIAGRSVLLLPKYKYFEEICEEYSSVLLNPIGRKIAQVEGTNECIGIEADVSKGKLILLPSFSRNIDVQYNILDDISEDFDFFDTDRFEIPPLANNYSTCEEQELNAKLRLTEEKIKSLKQELKELERQKEIESSDKLLFCGMGAQLEQQVCKVFEALGCTVETPFEKRADDVITFKDKIAVVEVKGIERKSAAEKNAAQLEKWVSEYWSDEKSVNKPKGILVANAFARIPLEKRSEPVFPPQMLKYATNREHCLITGLQLFNIMQHIKQHPEDKEKITDTIFDTIGCYTEFMEWNEFLNKNAL